MEGSECSLSFIIWWLTIITTSSLPLVSIICTNSLFGLSSMLLLPVLQITQGQYISLVLPHSFLTSTQLLNKASVEQRITVMRPLIEGIKAGYSGCSEGALQIWAIRNQVPTCADPYHISVSLYFLILCFSSSSSLPSSSDMVVGWVVTMVSVVKLTSLTDTSFWLSAGIRKEYDACTTTLVICRWEMGVREGEGGETNPLVGMWR